MSYLFGNLIIGLFLFKLTTTTTTTTTTIMAAAPHKVDPTSMEGLKSILSGHNKVKVAGVVIKLYHPRISTDPTPQVSMVSRLPGTSSDSTSDPE
jgi:hypothetical protein